MTRTTKQRAKHVLFDSVVSVFETPKAVFFSWHLWIFSCGGALRKKGSKKFCDSKGTKVSVDSNAVIDLDPREGDGIASL